MFSFVEYQIMVRFEKSKYWDTQESKLYILIGIALPTCQRSKEVEIHCSDTDNCVHGLRNK